MRGWIVVGAALLVPATLCAQKDSPGKRCAFDTAAHRAVVASGVSVAAFANADTTWDRDFSIAIGKLIREQFHAPESIGTLFFPNVETLPPAVPSWTEGAFGFSIDSTGRIARLRWLEPTSDAGTNDELLRAFRAATDSGFPVQLPASMMGAGRDVRVEVRAGGPANIAPVVQLRVPMVLADAAPKLRSAEAPRFPPGSRVNGMQARVTLDFIVDETGRAVRGSMRLVSASHANFVESAINAVMAERFDPAKSGGCPVKFRVEQAIRYSMGGT